MDGDTPAGGDATVGDSTTAFSADATVAPAQLREEQINSAVSFLSHPKVRGRHRAAAVFANVSVHCKMLVQGVWLPARTPGMRKAVDPACGL